MTTDDNVDTYVDEEGVVRFKRSFQPGETFMISGRHMELIRQRAQERAGIMHSEGHSIECALNMAHNDAPCACGAKP